MPVFPKVYTTDRVVTQLQDNIANALNPLSSNPVLTGIILPNVVLAIGSNTINHRLGRKLQGWTLVRQRGPATIYDTQDTNLLPEKTLVLNASVVVSVDIYVL